MGIGTRSNEFTLADFISLFQCPLTGRADAICLPFDGIDPRATARRACDVPIASSPDRGDQQGDSCRREGHSDKAPLKPACPLLHPPGDTRSAVDPKAISIRTAQYTFPQVIFHDYCASRRKLLAIKGWQQRANIGTATNRLRRIGCDCLAFACLQPRPNALR